jgi:hypothetical protein
MEISRLGPRGPELANRARALILATGLWEMLRRSLKINPALGGLTEKQNPSLANMLLLTVTTALAPMVMVTTKLAKFLLGGRITRGFQTLKNLSALLDNPELAASYDMSYDDATEHFSNLYYTFIPHAFSRNRPPIIRSRELLEEEMKLLGNLKDKKNTGRIMKPKHHGAEQINLLDRQFQELGIVQP